MKVKREKIQIYAGVSLMTFALLMHLGLNINNNSRTREVAFDNSQKIGNHQIMESDLDKDKRKGR